MAGHVRVWARKVVLACLEYRARAVCGDDGSVPVSYSESVPVAFKLESCHPLVAATELVVK